MVSEGTPKITKNHKKSEKGLAKGNLNSIPQKTSKIIDFERVWDLPNRAETRARASFSLIRLGTQKCPKLLPKAPILEALGTKIRKNVKNNRFWEGLGPAKSCWDSGESVVFTNSPRHEKIPKWLQKASIWEALGTPKSEKVWKSDLRKNSEFLGAKKNLKMTSKMEAENARILMFLEVVCTPFWKMASGVPPDPKKCENI